jgi:hypothetical protein
VPEDTFGNALEGVARLQSSPGLRAISSTLKWAIDHDVAVLGKLSPPQLRQLASIANGSAPWDWELYEAWCTFGQLCFRMNPPERVNTGDLFEALLRLGAYRTSEQTAYLIAEAPDRAAFTQLDYAGISKGISALQQKHRAGWLQHAERNKALVLQGAKQLAGRSAAVIGAGKAYDIPLRELAARYERLLLVDIDHASLLETAQHAFAGSVPAHVTLVEMDVTGIVSAFPARVREVLGAASDQAEAVRSVIELLRAYWLSQPPALFPRPLPKVDTVYSLMVLSQLATPLNQVVHDEFVRRFPASSATRKLDVQLALKQFTYHVQHDHIRALLSSCESFILTSDVTEQYCALGPDGRLVPISTELPMVGAQRLDELIPFHDIHVETAGGVQMYNGRVLAATGWAWPRIVPQKPEQRGSTMGVQGVAVRCERKIMEQPQTSS